MSAVLDGSRWVAYGLLIAFAFSVGQIIFCLIRARRAPFYAAREMAFRRARRWLLAALLESVLAIDLLIVLPRLADGLARPEAPVLDTPAPTLAATITCIPHVTCTPTTTPTRPPTATPPFIPTPTSGAPLPESALTPLPSAAPAGADAHITVITLAADRDAEGQPVDPGAEFLPGDHRVYLFITYKGMANGVAWTLAVYREGEFLNSSTQLWEWGAEGRTYLYYKPPGGYEPGVYEMRVFIAERLQGIAQFVIKE
jgi:hypothetical protein